MISIVRADMRVPTRRQKNIIVASPAALMAISGPIQPSEMPSIFQTNAPIAPRKKCVDWISAKRTRKAAGTRAASSSRSFAPPRFRAGASIVAGARNFGSGNASTSAQQR